MRIRNATKTDLEAIIALNAFVQQQHADALPELFKAPEELHQTREAFQALLADSTSLVLLAEETQPVGYLWAQFQNRSESWTRLAQRLLYIQHIAVVPQYQHNGIGTILLKKAIEIALKAEVKRVELDVWSFNAEARHFYEKHGFEVFNQKMALKTDGVDTTWEKPD
jgi:ribosomal protein S18 acetylase RimI-like enzyme